MVKIRLFRTGARQRPSYRIVAIDSRAPRQGRPIDVLGTYDPKGEGTFSLREDAVQRWIERGAQMSETVASLLRRHRRQQASAEAADA
jgi:small subunit ribosomal protein S16